MKRSDFFRAQAAECKRQAEATATPFERRGLMSLARHYEQEARRQSAEAVDLHLGRGFPASPR